MFSCVCCSTGCSWVCAVFSALDFIRVSSFALRSWSVVLEGSRTKEISFPGEDGGLLDLSQLERSSWTSSVVASWAVLRLKHGGRQCWGVSEISDRFPEHEREKEQ
jgi:hypothetical protein